MAPAIWKEGGQVLVIFPFLVCSLLTKKSSSGNTQLFAKLNSNFGNLFQPKTRTFIPVEVFDTKTAQFENN